ncbi:MAG: hypothetical protein M3Z33_02740 [Actinomycetota bacterium]|nr:hypothetical protein [Actinomycetota bacterium]
MRLRLAAPWLLAVLLALLYLVWAPRAPDLAAQQFRTDLFIHQGFAVWNGHWFGGHHTPGYSLLFPPLAALLSPQLVGALATVASAVMFERIARRQWGPQAWLGAVWFAGSVAAGVYIARLTFALGVAVATGAVLAAQRGRRPLAACLAALCSLASPVAGLFLALIAGAHALAERRRVGVELAAAALAPILVLSLAFPDAGRQTFGAGTFWPLLVYAAAVLLFVPRLERTQRLAALLYALAATAAFVLDTPMGSNVARLGTTLGPPLLACALWPHRRVALAALAPALLFWQINPVWGDLAKAGDASATAAYYAPLTRFLASHASPPGRVEVVPTRTHFEVVYVSEDFPLARGWERQLDTRFGGLFYREALDAGSYRRWLDSLGVRYVALPDARLDFAGRKEGRLVRAGLPFLRSVWRGRHWQVFSVTRAAALVDGAARLVALGPSSVSVRADRPGDALVRVRYSPYWKVVAGAACVERAPDDLLRLRIARAGTVRVAIGFSLDRVVHRGARCRR